VTALLDLLPALASRIARLPLGDWPTPVERFERASTPDLRLPSELWLKRDDQSSAVYGGSKLRLLEHLLADAQQRGARVVYSTGAAGSNFALATALHASRVGLEPAAISFPQPSTPELEQSHAALRRHARVMEIAHWALLPLASARAEREAAENGRFAVVLSQVRFDRSALFGYVAAGVELAQQVASGACPTPTRIVLPIGSSRGSHSRGVWGSGKPRRQRSMPCASLPGRFLESRACWGSPSPPSKPCQG
jgi:D-cysteine desulfhydrase